MLAAQQCEADLARLELDVWMADWRDESNVGRGEGVVGGYRDGEQPEPAVVGRPADAFEDGFPVEEVFVGGGAEVEERWVGLGAVLLDLLREALGSAGGGG